MTPHRETLSPLRQFVVGCSRCGENHYVGFAKLGSPVSVRGVRFDYSGPCENRGGEPVLMRYEHVTMTRTA